MTLSAEMETQINTIPSQSVQQFLKNHLNPNTDDYSKLFIDEEPAPNNFHIFHCSLAEASPLANFFSRATQKLCDNLVDLLTSMNPTNASTVIAMPCKSNHESLSGLYSIYTHSSPKTKTQLSEWVATLDEEHVMILFSGKETHKSIKIFQINEPQIIKNFAIALAKLTPFNFLSLFNTSFLSLYPRYNGWLSFFELCEVIRTTENLAFLLDIVGKFPDIWIAKFFYGVDAAVLQKALSLPMPLRKKIVDLMIRIPIEDARSIFTSTALKEDNKLWDLLEFKSLFYFLEEKKHPYLPYQNFTLWIKTIQKTFTTLSKSVLENAWSDENTLLHVAVRENKQRALNALLELGANPNCKNKAGLTALHVALLAQDKNTLLHFSTHKETDFHIAMPNGDLPIPYILANWASSHFAVFKSFLHNLNENHELSQVVLYFATCLKHLPNPRYIVDNNLQDFFNETLREKNLLQVFKDYCDQNEDMRSLFLLEVAKLQSTASSRELDAAILAFIEKEQADLISSDNRLEVESRERSLLLFLFALNPGALIRFLETIANEDIASQLRSLFCRGLSTPVFFSKLSLDRHQYLKASLPITGDNLNRVAEAYASRSNRHLVSDAVFKEYVLALSPNTLYALMESNPHPLYQGSLIVLSLMKELSGFVLIDERVTALLDKLHLHLGEAYLDDTSSNKKALRSMLNLVSHSFLHEQIDCYLQKTEQSSIHHQLKALFKKQHSAKPADRDSFLQHHFLNLAANFTIIDARFQMSVSQLLANMTTEDIETLMERQLAHLGSRLALHALAQAKRAKASSSPALKWPFNLPMEEETARNLTSAVQTCLEGRPHWSALKALGNYGDGQALRSPILLLKAEEEENIQLKAVLLSFTEVYKTILQNRIDKDRLLPKWIAWLIPVRHLLPEEVYLDAVNACIQNVSPRIRHRINQFENGSLEQFEHVHPTITALKAAHSWDVVVSTLSPLSPADLTVIRELAQHSNSLDFKHFIDSYLLNKEITAPEMPWSESQQWLHACLSALESHAAYALSIKALIALSTPAEEENEETSFAPFIELIHQYKTPIPHQTLKFAINYYQEEWNRDLFSNRSRAFIEALAEWFQYVPPPMQDALLLSLTAHTIKQLLVHCLSGITSSNPKRKDACDTLMKSLCRGENVDRETQLECIKTQLNTADLRFLGNQTFISLARKILSETYGLSLDMITENGVWIQRLLLCLQFVVAISQNSENPQINLELFEGFIEHYRALCKILKEQELARLNALLEKSSTAPIEGSPFLMTPEKYAHFKQVRDEVLSFQLNICIRALLNRLEITCLEEVDNPEMAKRALATLHAYYTKQVSTMTNTFLFRTADYLYTKMVRNRGDAEVRHSVFLSWLHENLSHYKFIQYELIQKVKQGKSPNQDRSFSKKAGDNQNPGLQENIFQNVSSALLVSHMPIEKMIESETALNLLFEDIFCEKSLQTLFDNASNDRVKTQWLKEEVSTRLSLVRDKLPAVLIHDLVQYMDIAHLLYLLQQSKNIDNACQLFHAILTVDVKREQLLEKAESKAIKKFFTSIQLIPFLSEFLERYNHHEIWFYRGLMLFTLAEEPNALSKAIKHLHQKITNKVLDEMLFQELITNLLANDNISRTVLDGFLNAPNNPTLFYPYVKKANILPAIFAVNRNPSWFQSPQYQLVLQILGSEHEKLFQEHEAHASEQSWKPEELKLLVYFTNRQLFKNPDCPVSQYLLAKMVFRCAAMGLTCIFYKNVEHLQELEHRTITATLKRTILDAFAARFYLFRAIKGIKENIEDALDTAKQWLLGREPINADNDAIPNRLIRTIESHGGMIDWKQMSDTSWEHVDGTKLPILSAFLLNYDGNPDTLNTLLTHIFQDPRLKNKNPAILNHISTVMARYPSRDVSQIIFLAFEQAAIASPEILNEKLFRDMAAFHSQREQLAEDAPEAMKQTDSEKKLLKRFGQQKLYSLTHHCAKLLIKPRSFWKSLYYFFFGEPEHDKLLKKVAKEATVEKSLDDHKQEHFFPIREFLVRFWNGTRRKPSNIIKWCNDPDPFELNDPIITRVNAACLRGQILEVIEQGDEVPVQIEEQPGQLVHENAQEAPSNSAREIASSSTINQGRQKFGHFSGYVASNADNASNEATRNYVM